MFRRGPYRFFLYSGDKDEPRHVHIERDNRVAKFWLDPVTLDRSGGLRRADIGRVRRLVEDNRDLLGSVDIFTLLPRSELIARI